MAGGHDRINVQNNPVNYIDPLGLQSGAPTAPGMPLFPPILPPVFYPGTPENDAFVRDVNSILDYLVDQIRKPFLKSEDDSDEPCEVPTSPPDGLVENPNRPGSWGEYGEDGKFKEKWRLDKGRPDIKRGHGSEDHIHLDGKKRWYPVKRK